MLFFWEERDAAAPMRLLSKELFVFEMNFMFLCLSYLKIDTFRDALVVYSKKKIERQCGRDEENINGTFHGSIYFQLEIKFHTFYLFKWMLQCCSDGF